MLETVTRINGYELKLEFPVEETVLKSTSPIPLKVHAQAEHVPARGYFFERHTTQIRFGAILSISAFLLLLVFILE